MPCAPGRFAVCPAWTSGSSRRSPASFQVCERQYRESRSAALSRLSSRYSRDCACCPRSNGLCPRAPCGGGRAREGTLPALVSRGDIRGDLHMHSTWSDGRDPIEAMVSACRSLGYEYLAITDHSQRSAASRNLSLEGVKRQAEEIALLRERYPEIAILHGCEVDILPDGRLDFPDRVLAGLDIVLASLHDRAGHPPDQ